MTKVCSHASDVFAFGSVLYEILTRKIPFYEIKDDQEIRKIIVEGRRPQLGADECPEYSGILELCFKNLPEERIQSFSDLYTRVRKVGKDSLK